MLPGPSDVSSVVLQRFQSKFTRNCDKFSFQSPHTIDLESLRPCGEVRELSLNTQFGMAVCVCGEIRVSIFSTGKVIMKNVKDVAKAVAVAQTLMAMLGLQATLQVAAEDRQDY